ncbi:MAG: helix-turn-helix domain-containing protein [Opitutaceae bacterium]|nr:helix-turn-helix domain-containing protein [Opitutaceae bacterium]MBP9912673.1 helix-turn-helix domain-containing protein [Opitutaceae bacterium]
MTNNILKALAAARAKVSKLEQAIAAKRNRALATLHKEHGFADVGAFIKALKAAASASGGKVSAGGKKRRKRAVITAETKAAVKALAQDGKTSAEIARTAGISVPSVQNIKKELGLTKARKK